jgi:putative transposase
VVGRKRHLLIDTIGMLLAVILHPAHVRDRDGAGKLPRQARGSLVQPDGDDGGEGDGDEGDGGEGGGGASVVARCDAAPILELAGHGLDAMVLAMERGIGGEGRLAFLGGGMRAAIPRSADAARKGLPCPLGTFGPAAALGDRLARRRQHRRKKARPPPVVHLPGGEHHDTGPALAVADGVERRVRSALGAAPDAPHPRRGQQERDGHEGTSGPFRITPARVAAKQTNGS